MSTVPSQSGGFLSDIETLRRRAREHIAQGAITPGYHADREVVEEILAKEEEHADDLASLLEDFSA